MMNYVKKMLFVCMVMLGLSSCHCEHDVQPPAPFKLGWVLCYDGEVMSFCDYVKSGKDAIAIVYYVNPDYEDPIAGYAIYLNDLDSAEFSHETEEAQGTSCSLLALDGNENTYSLYRNEIESPLANNVAALWPYGQSAYIPSVAQMRQVFAVKDFINPRIEGIGGDPLPDEADDCWYWTSTEVENQQEAKAWLFSTHSGAFQETPKTQTHRARPVVTIYR